MVHVYCTTTRVHGFVVEVHSKGAYDVYYSSGIFPEIDIIETKMPRVSESKSEKLFVCP